MRDGPAGRRVAGWQIRRPTVPRRGRSRTRRASTGSATSAAGSSTSARRSSLRSRLSSYFQDLAEPARRAPRRWSPTAASVEWTVVTTEVEALQLEYSWIKEFDPRFNVKYRDDKSYPSLAVTLNEEFPRLQVMRGAEEEGRALLRARTPTPGRSARPSTCCCGSSRRAPARPASSSGPARSAAPACSATSASAPRPASAGSTPTEHRAIVDDFCDFMAGQTVAYLRRLEKDMQVAAADQDYERAARLRDDIKALERAVEKQAVVLGDGTDADVVAFAEDPLEAAVQVFYVRGGRVRGQRGWVVDKVEDVTTGDLVEHFIQQVYGGTARRATPSGGVTPSRARCWSRPCRRTPRRRRSGCRRCAAATSTSGSRSAATSGR